MPHETLVRSQKARRVVGRAAYLVQAHDLTVGLLDLLQLHQEVPEAGLGDDIIGGEDAHAVQLGGGVGLGRQMAANDLVFLKTTC